MRHRSALITTSSTLLVGIGCTFGTVWSYADDPTFKPTTRVAAVSDNHEFLLTANQEGDSTPLWLYSTAGHLVDTFSLSYSWRPVAATTYYCEPLVDYTGLDQSSEAMLVLHESGYILPWYHHAGEIHYAWSGLLAPPSPDPEVTSVEYIDLAQAHNGDLYLLTEEVQGVTRGRLWRYHDGTWTSTDTGIEPLWKPSSMSYDQYLDTVYVADIPFNSHSKVHRFASDLTPENIETVEDVVTDIESVASFVFLATSNDLEIRDPAWAIKQTRHETHTMALALEQPMPLRNTSTVYLWDAGFSNDGHRLHRYELEE